VGPLGSGGDEGLGPWLSRSKETDAACSMDPEDPESRGPRVFPVSRLLSFLGTPRVNAKGHQRLGLRLRLVGCRAAAQVLRAGGPPRWGRERGRRGDSRIPAGILRDLGWGRGGSEAATPGNAGLPAFPKTGRVHFSSLALPQENLCKYGAVVYVTVICR
jgi:hypothetical protein